MGHKRRVHRSHRHIPQHLPMTEAELYEQKNRLGLRRYQSTSPSELFRLDRRLKKIERKLRRLQDGRRS